MHIDLWSDLVCPWCFIGKRQLEAALAEFPHRDEVTIQHRAYQLNPGASTTTERTTEMLASKYGVDIAQAEAMQRNVTEAAAGVGLRYQLERTLSGNTRDGHRLVLWAQELDHARGQLLLERLFSAHFEQAQSIFDTPALVEFAVAEGFDADAAATMLASDAYVAQVQQEQQIAQTLGCQGVPFFVLDERFGVTGAQPPEVFASALQQAWDAEQADR
ncbi:MAG: DsbA family oxidoreductase [Candidatus Nanopelagicales bacterium]|nr:DsbA family oxidoreductase [Candidatus Nanopelagicales bacterium]